MVQVVAYFTGFETGDSSEMVSLGSNTVQSTTKRTGGYALKVSPALNESQICSGLSSTSVVVRAYLRISGTPGGQNNALQLKQADGTSVLTTLNITSASKIQLIDSASNGTTGTAVLSANTWYQIDFVSVSTSTLRAYVNGVLDVNTTDAGGGGTADGLWTRADDTGGTDIYIDDVRIDTGGSAAIGAGQTIARQGIAGTPNYNAWTKSGAATAALCWSDTPFSTATKCTDTVLADKQTMLVGKFSTDPGRSVEGTQVIGSGDTINACKVGLIAKASSGTPNIDILRRVGGVDTAVTKAITTSDAYYQTGMFTDTTTNLDAYEIGATDDINTTTTTVEDVWMFVDYTIVASATTNFVPGSSQFGTSEAALMRRFSVVAYDAPR